MYTPSWHNTYRYREEGSSNLLSDIEKRREYGIIDISIKSIVFYSKHYVANYLYKDLPFTLLPISKYFAKTTAYM